MRVTLEEVDRIASLSVLKLDDGQRKRLQKNLSEILEHAERLNEPDTTGVEPTTYVLRQQNVFREDKAARQWDRDSMLKNAPERDDGCFVVPKVVE
jgi:aspartyl-tRNA(Asn)/glutamyl-tRNA(Gln) amidotransferase subunit C